MDRNAALEGKVDELRPSLSARRAWIEILDVLFDAHKIAPSLSARRAWIEMSVAGRRIWHRVVALRKESVDRNLSKTHLLK